MLGEYEEREEEEKTVTVLARWGDSSQSMSLSGQERKGFMQYA